MSVDSISPRSALVAGSLALVPVIWYGIDSSLFAGVVSAVNVLLILGALYVAFEPVESHGEELTS